MNITMKVLTGIMLIISESAYSNDNEVCFYAEDEFKGNSTCLFSGQQIDLYQEYKKSFYSGTDVSIIDNDSIKSIKIPPGMMATIYRNDNFNAPFFSLTESINAEELSNLDMEHEISSIKVSENTKLNCNLNCAILETYKIKLSESFGKFWDDERLVNKQILLIFDSKNHNENDDYSISLPNGPSINIVGNEIIFSGYNMYNQFTFEYNEYSDELSFIIQSSGDTVQFQYIQTLKNHLVDISPIISFKWLKLTDAEPKIVIENNNRKNKKPLILSKSILTADTGEQNWDKRDLNQTSKLICSFTPFLNVYNYITQGTCQQLDRIFFDPDEYFSHNTKEKTLHIAGDSRPLKVEPLIELNREKTIPEKTNQGEEKNDDDETDNNYLTLSYIDSTHNHQSLSLPAAAKTCMTSIYSLLNSRLPRQIRPPCIDWTLDIMTDFTLLFGNDLRTWNSEYFSKVIDSIVRTGSTGVVVENTEIEQRFSHAIREKITDPSTGNPLSQMKTAFDYAQLSYLSYSAYYSSDDTPVNVEQLPLGIYELLLETFTYSPTIPLVIENGDLVAQPESEFEIEIIATPSPVEAANLSSEEIEQNRTIRDELIKIIEQWGERYQGTHIVDQDANPEMAESISKTLHAGHIVTGIIHRRLIIKRPGEIYVIVKFRGEIIAIVLADRFNNRTQVELVAAATQPDYVLTPSREGTVRGAGTAAVNELARYLQQQGARTLFSEVISQPSARVKQKVGFTFKSEF